MQYTVLSTSFNMYCTCLNVPSPTLHSWSAYESTNLLLKYVSSFISNTNFRISLHLGVSPGISTSTYIWNTCGPLSCIPTLQHPRMPWSHRRQQRLEILWASISGDFRIQLWSLLGFGIGFGNSNLIKVGLLLCYLRDFFFGFQKAPKNGDFREFVA